VPLAWIRGLTSYFEEEERESGDYVVAMKGVTHEKAERGIREQGI
jgi:hypothetical protein